MSPTDIFDKIEKADSFLMFDITISYADFHLM